MFLSEFACPSCGTVIQPANPVRIGREVQCYAYRTTFVVMAQTKAPTIMSLSSLVRGSQDFQEKRPPPPNKDLLLAGCPVFLGNFGALRQLSELAERGDSFILCSTVMLFWPSANCLGWRKGVAGGYSVGGSKSDTQRLPSAKLSAARSDLAVFDHSNESRM